MQDSDPKLGRKFDDGKVRMGLIPPYALEAIAKVLTIGAKKYAPDNWKYVNGRDWRYFDALLRHLNSHSKGEINDTESGLPHLAHAGACLFFLLDELITSTEKGVIGTASNSVTTGDTISGTNSRIPVSKHLSTTDIYYTPGRIVDTTTMPGVVS